jgi:2-dehydropantoate 2-reductase
VLLSDSRHAQRLSSGLLHINGRAFDPDVITPETYNGEKIGVLFICVKNYSIDETADQISDMIDEDTILMPLQNGLFSYNYLREHFPDNIVLEGFVQGPNTRIYGNDIVYQNPGVYHLGKNYRGMKSYAKAVYEIIREAGVPCVLEDDIRHAIWCKLMINVAGNALTALTDLDYVMIRNSEEAQKICRTIMQEYKFVAATEDVLITEADISPVYRLAKSNAKYYEYMNTVPTRESLTEIISDIPDGAQKNCKHFVGFYNSDDVLVAVMDLITGYPEGDDAFIGWFMVDGAMQGRGVGSQIIADVRASMKAAGYDYMSLSVIKKNEEAIKFWEEQGFRQVEEAVSTEGYEVYKFERDI